MTTSLSYNNYTILASISKDSLYYNYLKDCFGENNVYIINLNRSNIISRIIDIIRDNKNDRIILLPPSSKTFNFDLISKIETEWDDEKLMIFNDKVIVKQINQNIVGFNRKHLNYNFLKNLNYNTLRYYLINLFGRNVKKIFLEDIKKRQKNGLSIVIPAYNAEEFIKECLDSIQRQIYFNNNTNYEILLGIDNCQRTLDEVQKIRCNYKNLKVYMMAENKGPYVVRNTLIDECNYDKILFFDADDIMCTNMVGKLMSYDEDIIRMKFYNFTTDIKKKEQTDMEFANGVFLANKEIFNKFKGFLDWKCGADLEFVKRVENYSSLRAVDDYLFYRRRHDKSLTIQKDTSLHSPLRADYHKQIKEEYTENDITITPVKSRYREIKTSILFLVTTYNRLSFLKKTIETWYKTINKSYNWTLLVADDGSTDGTEKYLSGLKLLGVDVFVINNNHRGVHHQTNQLLKKSLQLKFDYGFKADDDLLFLKPGWDSAYIDAINKTGYDHLIYFDRERGRERRELRNPIYKDGILLNVVHKNNIQGAFWTFTKRVIEQIGFMDIKNFGLCGLGHVDYSFRCCRKGFNELENPFDIKNSNNYIILNKKNYVSNNCYRHVWNSPEKLIYKKKILNENRTFIPYNESNKKMDNTNLIPIKNVNINDYFDHIYCLNLDRKPEKWNNIKKKCNDLSIDITRFSAVDGNNIPNSTLKKYDKINKYAVGCLLSHYNIIKDAQKNNYERVLILEDDVLFCNDFNKKFNEFISKVGNWKLLYLGGTQHKWDGIKIEDGYYRAKNVDGTFAYAVDQSIYDDLLQTDSISNRPIDNILWDIQQKYYNHCYVCYPNLIIADVSESEIRGPREVSLHNIKMKWNKTVYR